MMIIVAFWARFIFQLTSNLNIFSKYLYHVVNVAQSDSVFLTCTSIPDTSLDLQWFLLFPRRLLDVGMEVKQTWWSHLRSSGYVYLHHKRLGQPKKSLPCPIVPIATPQRRILKKPSFEHCHNYEPSPTRHLTYSYSESR